MTNCITWLFASKSRAIRRCGELLKTYDAKGKRTDLQPNNGSDVKSQKEAAAEAGFSQRQKETAVRVANVPTEEFETLVESENPPTVTALAQRGKQSTPKPLVNLRGRDPEEFKISTRAQGELRRLADLATELAPGAIVRGAFDHERAEILNNIQTIRPWQDQLSTLPEGRGDSLRRCSRCGENRACNTWGSVSICAACLRLMIVMEWFIKREEIEPVKAS